MRHPFLRTLAGSGVTTDPNFENVTLLLHGDGTNGGQNNTFVDGSTNNFTITRNGNTTQGTFSPYGDNWSNYFDGTGDYLTAPANSALTFGTGDFTYELWVFHSTSGSSEQYADQGNSGFSLAKTSADKLSLSHAGVATLMTSSGTIPTKKWAHVAISRSGTSVRMFIDGVLDSTSTLSTNFSSTTTWFIGRQSAADAARMNGYISNLRAVKGTAVYTAAFTPPSAPLTAITNTSLLTCQSNRFRDASTNNFTITRNGDVSVQRFSPFSPTAAYAAGTIGGSGYFDGNGDTLSAADNSAFDLSNGAFTIEAFVYLRGNTQFGVIIGQWGTVGNNGYALRQDAGFKAQFVHTTNGSTESPMTASAAIALNKWTHIAVVRNSSSTLSLFVDGVREATNASFTATIFDSSLTLRVGGEAGGVNTNGYICDARLVKGTAVYDPTQTTLTVPTAPLTAITNTSLLLNFTNASIFDNAMMAVPETVGNAQIDTTTKKFGTGSLEFDGTGDWLLIPDSIDQRLGTGNFTIECWLYLSATGTARGIVGKGTSTTGWLLSTNTSNAVVFTYGTSTITSTGTLSGTTWYHIAVVREGTGSNQTKIYIDGTNDGTGTVSTDFTQTNAAYVGANRTGGDPMNGYIDDLRITKGVARYTANFTAPTAAFPDL